MKNSKKCSNPYTDEGIRDSFEFPYESSLENVNFTECDLTGADFSRAVITECDFSECILNN